MSAMRILAGIGTLALIGGLAACGTSAVPAAAPAPAATVTATASAPQVVINNNNPAPAPTQTVVVQPAAPAPAYVPASDAWNTAVAYYTAINAGDNWTAWNMLSYSVQGGWNNNYDTYVANFTPLSFDNVSYVSESGDNVTFTFTLHNHSTGYERFQTCTFTVDNGIITWSS
jgi:hypothetical protein